MFSMFNQIFSTIARFFGAFEKMAISIDNLADIGVVMSDGYKQKQLISMQAEVNALRLEHSTKA